MHRIVLFLLTSLLYTSVFAQEKKPNIIFILADDMGYTDLGCYGNTYIRTPNIDKLAAKGVKFTSAYSSCPVCSPSRAAILTGKYPARIGLTDWLVADKVDSASPILPAEFLHALPQKELTIAEALKKEGYKTGMVGKWHLGFADSAQPGKQGFDYERVFEKNSNYYFYKILSGNKVIHEDKGKEYLTYRMAEEANRFIEESKAAPFFLYFTPAAPHISLVPDPLKLPYYLRKWDESNKRYNPNYAAMVESLDEAVGSVIKKLEELKLIENTILVFTSDNGGLVIEESGPQPTSNLPLRSGKGNLYEGGIRIPMIFSWPSKIKEGFVTDNYTSNVDFFPTFLEAGNPKNKVKTDDGMSLLKIVTDKNAAWERGSLFWHYPHFGNQGGKPGGAIRKGDFKLIEFYEDNHLELYNLKDDIGEGKDISKLNPDITKELAASLSSWRKSVHAKMPLPNPAYKK